MASSEIADDPQVCTCKECGGYEIKSASTRRKHRLRDILSRGIIAEHVEWEEPAVGGAVAGAGVVAVDREAVREAEVESDREAEEEEWYFADDEPPKPPKMLFDGSPFTLDCFVQIIMEFSVMRSHVCLFNAGEKRRRLIACEKGR